MLDVKVNDLSYKVKIAMQHDSQKHTLRLLIVLNTRYITRTVLMALGIYRCERTATNSLADRNRRAA